MVYTSKGNAMFNQVVMKSSSGCCGSTCSESETVIWETNDPQKYASKVFADGVGACSSTKNVSIYMLNGEILHFTKGGRNKPWRKSFHKINLNLDKTSSTIAYDFVHHGETRTFTAKPGYQFSTIMLVTCREFRAFWKARNDDECSTKVTVYGVQTTVTNINIFLNNSQVKHFHKANGKWVSRTSIVLDIDKNKDNDLFEYRSTRHFGHFNPKPNLTIRKIVKTYKYNYFVSTCCGYTCCGPIDELEIWTAKPDDHGLKAVLMGSGWGEKHLSILLQSGNFVVLRKRGQRRPWKDITQEKSDFSGVKMYSLEEGTSNYHELTGNDYDAIIFESRYGYEFKEGVKCVKITYNNETMWSHTDDPEFGYLKGLYLDLPKDQFSVTNLKDQTKQLEFKPTPITEAVTTVVSVTKPAVTKVTLDIEKNQSTNEFSYSDQNGVVTYTPKDSHVFSKVSQGTKVIWESKDDVFGILVRTKTSKGVKYLVVLLTNNMFTLFNLDGNEWKDITSDRHDVKKLKFFGENDAEISKTNYTVTIVDLSFTYIFNSGVSCKKVKLGDEEVWNHTDDTKFAEIKSFSLGLASNSFFVKNQSDQVKKIEKELESGNHYLDLSIFDDLKFHSLNLITGLS
uniref:SfiI-subtelomeric related protein family member, putative n=1 Tax=Theileria annulata TaxID=5874 RepID=A0A3B0NFY7_THEAN